MLKLNLIGSNSVVINETMIFLAIFINPMKSLSDSSWVGISSGRDDGPFGLGISIGPMM